MQIIHTIPNSKDLLYFFFESRIQEIRVSKEFSLKSDSEFTSPKLSIFFWFEFEKEYNHKIHDIKGGNSYNQSCDTLTTK